jgi:hypothetical protein
MKRSVGASILAVIAAFAGVLAVLDVLRYLGLLPFSLGPVNFFGFSFIGAILAGIVAIIWFWAAQKLWNGDEQGWLFMVVLAIFYLILDFVSLLGGTPLSSMWTSIVLNVLVLVIAFLPGTKENFGKS